MDHTDPKCLSVDLLPPGLCSSSMLDGGESSAGKLCTQMEMQVSFSDTVTAEPNPGPQIPLFQSIFVVVVLKAYVIVINSDASKKITNSADGRPDFPMKINKS